MSKKEKKGFIKEFKEFISRGSIVDMAVGVVVGGAFTTIVNTLVKSVLTPLINFVVYTIAGGKEGSFSGLDIVLIPATVDPETGAVLKDATVLGFSDFITSIVNLLLITFTLFCNIKGINKSRESADELKAKIAAESKKAEEEEKAE